MLTAKWRRYPGAWLERNLQNGSVIRMAGFTHRLCLNIGEIFFYSYDIYSFAINRIYKKKLQYVYLGFSVGSRSSRNYFSNVRIKTVASDSKKKTVHNAVNRGVVRSSKKKFFDTVSLIS